MPQAQPGERQPTEFNFESYVERQFCLIHERLDEMNDNIAGLQADVDTLATVIPELADDLTSTHAELATKQADLEAAIAVEGQQADVIAKLEGELAQVAAIREKLDPVVEAAQSLVPAPAGDGGAEQPEGGTGSGPGEPPLGPPAGGDGEAGEGAGSAGTGAGGV